MKIKELHNDIERYLLHDCYCPHEIYSADGFFFTLFYEDQECELIGKCIEGTSGLIACIAHPFNDESRLPQIVMFSISNDKVVDSVRFDATKNNVELTAIYIEKGGDYFASLGRKFDEYEPGATARSLGEVMSMADVIMVD